MSIAAALRRSVSDLYFNSWRLAPANLVWGVLLVAILLIGPATMLGLGLTVLLAVPAAGVYRMAALIARDEPAAFSDFVDGMRRSAPAAVATGAAATLLAVVFVTNVRVGLGADNPILWFVGAMALWGLVGLAMFLVGFFPVLVDPRRAGEPVRRRAILAGLAVLGRPIRTLAVTLVVLLILAVSTVLVAALVLVGLAYVALVSARVMLPLIDDLEERLPARPAG